jgi:hypothetical protein
MSGEALTRAHALGVSPQTAIEDCVRARVCTAPLRTPAQLRQLQFHCGKPPPAAEPNTRIFKGIVPARQLHRAKRGQEPGFAKAAVTTPSTHRAPNPERDQRLAIYIVISMPNRKSVACGVSHFITMLLVQSMPDPG